jgi:hypothetical protein
MDMRLSIILALIARIPTTPETAASVLERLEGVRYTLVEVDIPLIKQEALLLASIIEED